MASPQPKLDATMKRLLTSIASAFLTISVCHAETVFKCTTESRVAFQSVPCVDGSADAALLPSAAINETTAAAVLPAPAETNVAIRSGSPPIINAARGRIQIGTSDLWVLNNRRWGKPQRISRNREARAWHEYWNYETGANSGVQLHFINGKVARVNEIEAPASSLPEAKLIYAVLVDER
jgi:hypothetical protein